jgi:hypothetical protein
MVRNRTFAAFILAAALIAPVTASARPTVVELFTSQGCSSCPAAETLVRQLSQDPSLLALSFHVHYFDYLGWKDPFASEANTARQKAYVSALSLDSVFTPEIVVDGAVSVIGSDDRAVEKAVTDAENHTIEIPVSIAPQTDGNLHIAIGGPGPKQQVPEGVVAWEVHFLRGGVTNIEAGENQGTMLESTNNVMRYVPMPIVAGRENDFALSSNFPEDGVAIIVQQQPVGRIIGAAVYFKPGAATATTGQWTVAR